MLQYFGMNNQWEMAVCVLFFSKKLGVFLVFLRKQVLHIRSCDTTSLDVARNSGRTSFKRISY